MKVCPTCRQTFNDDNLAYCLMDGAQLVVAEGQPTVVIADATSEPTVVMTQPQVYATQPQTPPVPVKKKNKGLWIGLIIVVMLAGIVAVAGGLMLFYSGKREAAQNGNQKNGVNNAATPRASATPKPSVSATQAASPATTPAANTSKSSTDSDGSDEVTPIAWTTSAASFKTDVGQTYKFQCPENGIAEMVWGSDIYTADSSICTAAVHAGVITLERGGEITIEFRPGRSIYGSTTRNGITSSTFGEYPHSFVVR